MRRQGGRDGPGVCGDPGARTWLIAPSFAFRSGRARAACAQQLLAARASKSLRFPDPGGCPGPIPGQSWRGSDPAPSFFQGTPSRRAPSASAPCYTASPLPVALALWFIQREAIILLAGIQLGCREQGGGQTAAKGYVHLPEAGGEELACRGWWLTVRT